MPTWCLKVEAVTGNSVLPARKGVGIMTSTLLQDLSHIRTRVSRLCPVRLNL